MEEAARLARQAAPNSLAAAAEATGGLDHLVAVRRTVWVASAPESDCQHLVADGASGLLLDVLGDAGHHARAALAAPVVPLSSPVEVKGIYTTSTDR